MKYRVEDKYICNAKDFEILDQRLKRLLKIDKNAGETSSYLVKSVYFDTLNDRCFYENEDGIGERKKYRIRIYNNDLSLIRLEVKSKMNSYCYKDSSVLSQEVAKEAILGRGLPLECTMPKAYHQTLIKMRTACLRPVIIVEYSRKAYTYKEGNVRITLDMEITGTSNIESFFGTGVNKTPILPQGHFILEVKYDEFLPSYIKNALGLSKLNKTAFSKYYLTRKIEKSSFFNFRRKNKWD